MTTIELRPRQEQDTEVGAVPAAGPVPEKKPTVLDQVGGVWGFVYATVPVLVFVVANSFVPLLPTIAFSMAAAFAMAGWRVLRGEEVMAALGGVFGVAAAAGMVAVADATGGLAVAKIAMGTPLTVVLALLVIGAFRRSTKRLTAPA